DAYDIIDRLKHVNGILSMSPIIRLGKSEDEMKRVALELESTFNKDDTFKVEVKSVDKSFHLKTHDIKKMIGGNVVKEKKRPINTKHPDHINMIEVRDEGVYMYSEEF